MDLTPEQEDELLDEKMKNDREIAALQRRNDEIDSIISNSE